MTEDDGEDSGDREEPLEELAEEIDRRSDGDVAAADELFEERDVEEIDRDALWDQVASGDDEADADDLASTADDATEGERVVDKSRYCQRCEFFSDPPEVHCTHEGTEIVEAVDVDHFLVRNCPVVKQDEELEDA